MTCIFRFKGFSNLMTLGLRVLLTGACVATASIYGQTNPCQGPSYDKITEVKLYVAKLNHIEKVADLRLLYSGVANRACFWRLSLAAKNGQPIGDYFLSPDRQFVSPTLFDLSDDPLAKEQERNRLTKRILSTGNPPKMGSGDEQITVVEFADFECPFCKQQAEIFKKELMQPNGTSLRFEFRQFPLRIHPWARKAAEASACVGSQSQKAFWLVHDNLYRNQSAMKIEDVNRNVKTWLAHESSFDAGRFDECMENGQGADSVRTDEAIGRQLGVEATPTLFVNGTMLKGLHTADRIREEISENRKQDTSSRASAKPLAPSVESDCNNNVSGRCGSGVQTTNRQ